MYLQSLDALEPGDVLAKTILDEDGRPLLVAGTSLTPRFVVALRRRGVLSVYISDGLADDIVPSDIVSERVRATVTSHVADVFGMVAGVATDRSGVGGVSEAIGTFDEGPIDLGNDGADQVERLYSDVEDLIAEILETNTVAGLESLKTHNEYTFQHSVDVAVVGVLLGKRVGMPRNRLRELALGCLMHDIGKTFIDVAILDKQGPLTREEFEAVKEHPRMGYELVRRMPFDSLLPAHVAFQHHEQQGGGGYPRGLVGHNRVAGRTLHEKIGAGQMLLIAEIGAVADVYSALSSDRPYRAAMPPDEVAALLTRMGGRHLNREIVKELRTLVPAFPVGRWVELCSGRFAGFRGVVTEVHRGDVDRPTVRLLLDEQGEALASPDDMDTRTEEGALRCLAGVQSPTEQLAPTG